MQHQLEECCHVYSENKLYMYLQEIIINCVRLLIIER